MKKTVLMYNFASDKLAAARSALKPLGCSVRGVSVKEQKAPVGALAGAAGYTSQKSKTPPESFSDGFIVICGFSGKGLDVVIAALASCGIKRDTLKAVMTDTNAAWSGAQLYKEVSREHKFFSEMGQ